MSQIATAKQSKGTYSLLIDRNTAVYFNSFGNEYILHEVLSKIKDKSVTCNTFRIQFDDSIMCGSYCITWNIKFQENIC